MVHIHYTFKIPFRIQTCVSYPQKRTFMNTPSLHVAGIVTHVPVPLSSPAPAEKRGCCTKRLSEQAVKMLPQVSGEMNESQDSLTGDPKLSRSLGLWASPVARMFSGCCALAPGGAHLCPWAGPVGAAREAAVTSLPAESQPLRASPPLSLQNLKKLIYFKSAARARLGVGGEGGRAWILRSLWYNLCFR